MTVTIYSIFGLGESVSHRGDLEKEVRRPTQKHVYGLHQVNVASRVWKVAFFSSGGVVVWCVEFCSCWGGLIASDGDGCGWEGG